MRVLPALSVVVLSTVATACQSGSAEPPSRAAKMPAQGTARRTPAQGAATSTASEPSKAPRAFGAPLGAAPRESLASVLEQPAAHAGKTLVVDGHVRRACSKKGCWMELAVSSDPKTPACRVTFKDYGFLVPTNSAGSEARLEGVMNVRRVEPGLVSHLEAEGAIFAKKSADGSAEEVRFVATGVELFEKGT